MKKTQRNRYKFILRCVAQVRAGGDPFEVFFAQYRQRRVRGLALSGGDHLRIRLHLLDIATAPDPDAVKEPGWVADPWPRKL
jgi:hypothetical protein